MGLPENRSAFSGRCRATVFLFETSPRDPGLVTAGVGLMALVVLLASYLPARRATRVDPALELKRQE